MNTQKPFYLFLLLTAITSSYAQTYFTPSIKKFTDSLINAEYPDRSDRTGASVLIAEKGEIVYQKVNGMADLERGVKVSAESVFEIGSISKQFAAVALLQLVQQNKIHLLDDIRKYVSWFNSHGETITIENLLTHTSGIRDYDSYIKPFYVSPIDRSVPEMIRFFMNENLNFKPGTSWAYSNSGYLLLAYIVELVSDMDYHDYVQTNIFKPLGMNHTYFGTNEQIIPNRARGYSIGTDGSIVNSGNIYCWAYGAGDILSTTADLLIWINALRDNKIISKELLQKAWTNHRLPSGELVNYGYGFFVNRWGNEKIITHSGLMYGYTCEYIYLPSKDFLIVQLTNADYQEPTLVPIVKKLIGDNLSLTEKETATNLLDEYQGVYLANKKGSGYTSDFGPEKEYFYIKKTESKLSLQRSGGKIMNLYEIGIDSFTNKSKSILYSFTRKEKAISDLSIIGYPLYPLQYGPIIRCPKIAQPMLQVPVAVKIAADELDKYCGKFILESSRKIILFRKGDQLFLKNREDFPLTPIGEDLFYNSEYDMKVKFIGSKNGIDTLEITRGQIMKGFRLR